MFLRQLAKAAGQCHGTPCLGKGAAPASTGGAETSPAFFVMVMRVEEATAVSPPDGCVIYPCCSWHRCAGGAHGTACARHLLLPLGTARDRGRAPRCSPASGRCSRSRAPSLPSGQREGKKPPGPAQRRAGATAGQQCDGRPPEQAGGSCCSFHKLPAAAHETHAGLGGQKAALGAALRGAFVP